MSYVRGEDRGQAALLPAAVEDYVAAASAVRVIDAFVDGLDVVWLGFTRSVSAATGRPPYDPRDLLKLYLYGYLNEVRWSRRLERECSRNVEVMWLLRRLAPDFKTIADFRQVATLTVVADAGYSNGAAAAACENDGITPCVPANRSTNNQGDGTLFDRSAFVYQADSDTYRCPAGRPLVRKQIMRRDNCVLYAAQDCSDCALKARCTTAERRFLTRHLNEDALQRMNARVVADPGLMRQRRCAAEHPFGTIKRMTAGGRFLSRGLPRVKAEAALSVLAYNILRTINLIGATPLRLRMA
jgi:transposase